MDLLGKRIETAIKRSGLKKADVARKLGVTPQAITGWCKKNSIEKFRLYEVAELLGVPFEWLMTGNDKELPSAIIVGPAPLLTWEALELKMEMLPPCFTLAIDSDVMAPRIPEGAQVILRKAFAAHSGDIVVASVNGSPPILREYRLDGGRVLLRPTNPAYVTEQAPGMQVRILGVVDFIDLRRQRQ